VRYELGFYNPEEVILHSHRRERSNLAKFMFSLIGEYGALLGAPRYYTFQAGSFLMFTLLCSSMKCDSSVRMGTRRRRKSKAIYGSFVSAGMTTQPHDGRLLQLVAVKED
jgi:hypothetical protein